MRKLFEVFKVVRFQKKNSCHGIYKRKYGKQYKKKIATFDKMRKLFEVFKVVRFQKKNSCHGNYKRKYGKQYKKNCNI